MVIARPGGLWEGGGGGAVGNPLSLLIQGTICNLADEMDVIEFR